MKAIIYLPIASMILSLSAMATGEPSGTEKMSATEVVQEWVKDNLEYPSRAIEGREEGSVEITFTLENGEINAWVSTSASRNLDAAALEVVQDVPLSKLLIYSTPTDEHFTIPIKFTLI